MISSAHVLSEISVTYFFPLFNTIQNNRTTHRFRYIDFWSSLLHLWLWNQSLIFVFISPQFNSPLPKTRIGEKQFKAKLASFALRTNLPVTVCLGGTVLFQSTVVNAFVNRMWQRSNRDNGKKYSFKN